MRSWIRAVNASGLTLLVTGVVVGWGSRAVDPGVVHALAPLGAIAVGWIGATIGVRLRWSDLRTAPSAVWAGSAARTVVTAVVAGVGLDLLLRFAPLQPLAAAAAPVLPTVLALGAGAAIAEGEALVGVAALTLILGLFHIRQPVAGNPLSLTTWFALTVASGALTGILWTSFDRVPVTPAFTLLAVLLTGAGLGYAAALSPLVVCVLGAALMANLAPAARLERIRSILQAGGPAVDAVLLVYIGTLLRWSTPWVGLWILLWFAVCWLGRMLDGRFQSLRRMPEGVLPSVLPSLALAVYWTLPSPGADTALTVLAIGTVLARLPHRALLTVAPAGPELTG